MEGAAGLGRRFWTLWAASTTSALGSGLTTIAMPLLVASRTSDPLAVSGAFAVSWLPWLLFALPGGVLVDRVDRRRLVVAIDAVRVVAVDGLAAVVATGRGSTAALLAALLAVLFVINAGEVVLRSAAQAVVPSLVTPAQLDRANGWLVGGTVLVQQMLAGPLGGFLFVPAASSPFAANAVTYTASAVLVASLPRGRRPAPGPVQRRSVPRSVLGEVAEGFRWLVHQRLLRTMALLIGLLNVTLTAATAVLVLLARERLHLGSVGYGLLFTCMAVGGVLGSVAGDRLVARVGATWTVRVGLLVEAGTRLTPPELLGRVGSTTLFLAAGGNCVGALLGGALVAAFGLTAPYWVGFVVAVAVSAATWRTFDRTVVDRAWATAPPTTTRPAEG